MQAQGEVAGERMTSPSHVRLEEIHEEWQVSGMH